MISSSWESPCFHLLLSRHHYSSHSHHYYSNDAGDHDYDQVHSHRDHHQWINSIQGGDQIRASGTKWVCVLINCSSSLKSVVLEVCWMETPINFFSKVNLVMSWFQQRNQIGTVGAKYIADALQINSSLIFLDLKVCFSEGEGESHHVVAINRKIKLEMKERNTLLVHFSSTLLSPTWIWGFVSYDYWLVRVKVNLIMCCLSTGQWNINGGYWWIIGQNQKAISGHII